MSKALDDLKKSGMESNDLSGAEMARLRDAVKPVVEKFAKDSGEGLYGEIQAALAKLRK